MNTIKRVKLQGLQDGMVIENPHEVITRRKEESIKEHRQNHQIQQSATLPKKQILIPVIEEKEDLKSNVNQLKREQLIKLKQEQIGYILLQDINNSPSIEIFEPDGEDIELMKNLIPNQFKNIQLEDPAIFGLSVYRDFIKVIDYIEATRDFDFKNLSLPNSKLNAEHLQKIVEYWKMKTARTKYPLKRKYWAANIKKEEFGKLDQLRLTYREREPEKRKMTRQSRKMTNIELLAQLESVQQNSRIIETLLSLEVMREKIRLGTVKAQIEGSESVKQFKDSYLNKMEQEIENAKKVYEFINPPLTPPLSPKPPVPIIQNLEVITVKPPAPVDNQIACYISTLIHELEKFGFDINEIKSENIGIINSKIRSLKQAQNPQVISIHQEKMISVITKSVKPVPPSFENYVPYKRFSYECSNEIFIEKIEREKLMKELADEKTNNFVPDFLIKRNLSDFSQYHSMFRINAVSGLHPDISCDATNYSTNNVNLENLKNLKYIKLLDDFSGFNESALDSGDYENGKIGVSLVQKAATDVNKLNLGNGFKNWMNNKKVKTS